MIPTWLRKVIIGLVGLPIMVGLLFCYVCWLSPASRLGKHHQQQSYLVRPGMNAQQAFEVMGHPQQQQVRGEEVIYTYTAHPFAADDVYLAIGREGVVKGISHGD